MGHVRRLSLDDARGRRKKMMLQNTRLYRMTLEGCAHIFEGCSQIMLRDCPWMMLEAEKMMLQNARLYDIRRLCPYI